MDRLRNPYAPGAGRRPAALAGRTDELDVWETALHRAAVGRTDRSVVLHGLRGVGKTVLLGEYLERAVARGWYVAHHEAGPGGDFRAAVARSLYPSLRAAARRGVGQRLREALATFRAFSVGVDTAGTWSFAVEVEPAHGRADSGNLEFDLIELVVDLAGAAREAGTGVALLLDEMQDLDAATLAALCTACHFAGQRNLPFLLGAAGLPSLPRVLSEARSYAERLFTYRPIAPLSDAASREALTEPATAEGVTWHTDAMVHVTSAAGGYPYFLQEFGQATWRVADGDEITADDARIGVAEGTRQLDAGFFRARWDRATPGERDYLRAMAVDGAGPSSSGEVAARLGKSHTSLGPVRAKLIGKGLVYAPEHGQIAYTVPGMAAFITRTPA
ncbi:MAG TPA: ATP-binding protein [Intrasporangium sp.]|uniref:ATP-binding protein n=1 Tax=Intrasporangium sp. TaxID=1925024 RepID=UPI002D77CAFD|nr:ATP-binding protein [Intrasporangium sp.]HET7397356.1 ATP-binding protein [Intrasporangium sp.]